MNEDIVFPSVEAWGRVSRAVRYVESWLGGHGEGRQPTPAQPEYTQVTVEITGEAVLMAPPLDPTLVESGDQPARYVYPAKIVWRNVPRTGNADEWGFLSRAWAFEINFDDLKVGGRYLGVLVGVYGNLGLVAVGGTGSFVRVRVTGRPSNLDGTLYYPAVLDLNDASGVGYHDGPDPLWVVQRHGQYLDTRGLSTYTARRKLASFNVPDCDGNDDERPLYDTREHIVVVRVDFDPVCQAYYDGVFEGPAVCDYMILDSGEDVTLDSGELVGVG